MSDPCAGLDTCHYWYSHDDRCDRVTAAHSTMCDKHQEHDYNTWWEAHAAEDCCWNCCKGEIEHE